MERTVQFGVTRPPSRRARSRDDIYVVSHTDGLNGGGSFTIRKFQRTLDRVIIDGRLQRCVRFDKHWQRVYPAKAMRALLAEIKATQCGSGMPYYLNRPFRPRKDGLLPFIKDWESPFREYRAWE
jgi:hypothetical protein